MALPDEGRSWSSRAFWSLPHETRRMLYKVRLRRSGWPDVLDEFRNVVPEDPELRTLVPLLESGSVFVHVPKAAGVAVGRALYGRATGHHWTAREYQLMLTRSEWRSALKFAFVREPVERFQSAYDYLVAGGRTEFDQRMAEASVRRFADINDFVEHGLTAETVATVVHFRPQHHFVCDIRGRPLVDFVGRFERLSEDYEQLRLTLGFGDVLRPDNQTRNRASAPSHLSAAAVARLVEVYRNDFAVFDYPVP